MHIHLPKPLHGWREFVGEVGIIVIGVLIALGAEQAVEAMHHRSQVHEMSAKLRAESLDNQDAIEFSRAGLQKSIASIDRDLSVLQNCKAPFDSSKLAVPERRSFLVPLDAAWLGLRDSALLPLMPEQTVGDYWKLDTIGSFMGPMLSDVDHAFNDAAAAVDTLRSGVSNPQSCAQAVFQLYRLKGAEQTLDRQASFYQNSNKQVLRGAGLGLASTKAILPPSGQDAN